MNRKRRWAIRALLRTASVMLATVGPLSAGAETWRFDRTDRLGSAHTRLDGMPRVTADGGERVVVFDGVDDAIDVARHPLAGARTFTFEAIFRPDGGAFAQRWFHLAEAPAKDAPAPAEGGSAMARTPRIMFEIRVVGDSWYLDCFMTGSGYNHTLVDPTRLHPVGRWYHVAQTYDGSTYRSYVDGVLEGEWVMPFTEQGAGAASIGARINRVDYFRGAVHSARFSRRALPPTSFLHVPRRLRQPERSGDATR